MKFEFKKYLFLINDVSNMLLSKERDKLGEQLLKMRKALIFVLVLFIISFILNIYLLIF